MTWMLRGRSRVHGRIHDKPGKNPDYSLNVYNVKNAVIYYQNILTQYPDVINDYN